MNNFKNLNKNLLFWYTQNKRDLPWRSTMEPYKIWVSEIILQQTKVKQGLQYYYNFIDAFPDISSLAVAPIDELMKIWQGLGYYNRAINMHEAAKQIINDYNGVFPKSFKELLKLKGVGKYTAGAIASIAYNEKAPVVDGNVFRVLSRLFGTDKAIDLADSYEFYANKALKLMGNCNPGTFNQAVMELGALICTPNPDCNNCPLQKHCIAFKSDLQKELPVRIKKKSSSLRFFNYIFISFENEVLVRKRSENDIWKGLYDFPLIESEIILDQHSFLKSKLFHDFINNDEFVLLGVSKQIKVKLTHQTLFVNFYRIQLKKYPSHFLNCRWVKISELSKLAVPACISEFLKINFDFSN